MKNKRIWIAVAFTGNLLLLPFVLATPHKAQASAPDWLKGDCCQESVEEVQFCCDDCCWFKDNCNSSADCRPTPK